MECRYPSPGCVPTTCKDQGATCGSIDDACGGRLHCGDCATGQVCGDELHPNVCLPTQSCPLGKCGSPPPG
jgi:hypothetical protein